MKQHFTKLTLRPGMDVTRMLNARPICGQRPTYYAPAVTNDWDKVDCARCLAQKPTSP